MSLRLITLVVFASLVVGEDSDISLQSQAGDALFAFAALQFLVRFMALHLFKGIFVFLPLTARLLC